MRRFNDSKQSFDVGSGLFCPAVGLRGNGLFAQYYPKYRTLAFYAVF